MNRNERHIINELQKRQPALPGDDYFAQLKTDVLGKLPQAKIIPLYRRWWMVSAAAASVVIVLLLTFMRSEVQPKPAGPDWDSVTREELFAYVEENIADFETEAIAEQLSEIPDWTNVSVANPESAQPTAKERETDQLFDQLEKEEILDYLQEEDLEYLDEDLLNY